MKTKRLSLAIMGMCVLLGCTAELQNDGQDLQPQNLKAKASTDNTLDQELFRIKQKMRRFQNFRVAEAQGWTFGPIYVPGMGNHYINEGLLDPVFELEKPEALLYYPDENGVNQFLAVEYLIPGPESNPPPEGYTGSEDVWEYNAGIGAWTLHVWVGVENPNGIFAATHPDY